MTFKFFIVYGRLKMSTTIMDNNTQHSTSGDNTHQEQMVLLKVLYDMLKAKYPVKVDEKAASYMDRLLVQRKDASPNSILFVETELLMLFLLLNTLRNQINKAKEAGENTSELLSSYVYNRERFEDYIDTWIEKTSTL